MFWCALGGICKGIKPLLLSFLKGRTEEKVLASSIKRKFEDALCGWVIMAERVLPKCNFSINIFIEKS